MASAKDIVIKRINSRIANDFVRKNHYSGKVVPNSQLHLGVYLNGWLHGVMQFGPPFDRRKILPLVKGAKWSSVLELNRMAFDQHLPKNSESRAISVAIKLIKKKAPFVKWIVSFADATQCGHGTIYQASGFKLTKIKRNNSIIKLSDGSIRAKMTFTKGKHILKDGRAGIPEDAEYLVGYQLRYIYFLDEEYQKRFTGNFLPYSEVSKIGAKMYKGKRL